MKRILFVLVAMVLLSTSCLNAPTESKTGTKYDATQDARIVSLEGVVLGPNGLQAIVGTIQQKISGISDVPSLIARVTSMESRLTTAESKIGVGGGVSQDTVDALSARIKTLEDWKAGLGSSSGGSTLPAVEGVLDSDGNLQLILDREVDEEIWLADGDSQTWRLTVKNNGTSSTYFRINADFDCEESVNITKATFTPSYASTVTTVPADYTDKTSIVSLPFVITTTGNNKIYIGKNREESLFVTLTIDYTGTATPGKLWTWDFSIRDVD